MIPADICFDDSRRIYVLLHRIIQHIILVKYLDEMRMSHLRDQDQRNPKDRRYNHHDNCNRHADRHRHDKGQHDHDRRSREQADRKHIRHLHVRNIRSHPGDKAGR